MLAALGWGALAAGSLVLGAALGVARSWDARIVGVVLAFGTGALTYFLADGLIDRSGGGGGASLALAIFVSNLPEAVGSATDLRPTLSRGRILALWVAVAVVCTGATVGGYLVADAAGGEVKAGRVAGLVTVLGFAVAAGLSELS